MKIIRKIRKNLLMNAYENSIVFETCRNIQTNSNNITMNYDTRRYFPLFWSRLVLYSYCKVRKATKIISNSIYKLISCF